MEYSATRPSLTGSGVHRIRFWERKMSKSKKRISTYNKLFIAFIVLVSIVCLAVALYYSVAFGDKNEQMELLLISLFISSFVGGMIFMPSHLQFLETPEYNFGTAVSNYFLMLIESTIMLWGFSLTDVDLGRFAGWYGQWFVIMLYLFFGIHLFSYPRLLKDSLFALISHIMFVVLNLTKTSGFETILPLLAKAGYTFALALVIAGFLMFFKPWLMVRKLPSQKWASKVFIIYSILYSLFILIPGLYFLAPGLGNYFRTSSTRLLILSVLYFIYILIQKVKRLTEGFIRFISIEDEGGD